MKELKVVLYTKVNENESLKQEWPLQPNKYILINT
jgi:hypothetical protein